MSKYVPIAQRKTPFAPKRYIPIAEMVETEAPTFELPDTFPTFPAITAPSTPQFLSQGRPDVFVKGGDISQMKAEALRLQREAEYLASPVGLTIETIKGIPKTLGEIGQMIARNIGSAAVTIGKSLGGADEVIYTDFPKVFQPIAKTIFREEPIKSIEDRVAEAELEIKDWGEKTKGVFGDIAKKHFQSLAFVGVMGSVGLDLTPFGGLEKNAFKMMIKTKTVGEAISLLLKMGVADDLARQFADDVVKVATEKEAKTLFNSIANLQKTTKIAPKVAPKIAPELEPLAQEARIWEQSGAYKEDFIKSIGGLPTDEQNKIAQQLIKAGFIEKPPIGYPSKITISSLGDFYDEVIKSVKPEMAISRELEPLLQEARKFKSAEEFYQEVVRVNKELHSLPTLRTTEATIKQFSTEAERTIARVGKMIPENIDPTQKGRVIDFYNQAVRVKQLPTKTPAQLVREVPRPTPIRPTKAIVRETTGQVKAEYQAFKQRIKDLARGAREGALSAERRIELETKQARIEHRFLEALERDVRKGLEVPKGKERSRISFIKELGEFNQTAIRDAKSALGIEKPIREMNLEELLKLSGEMKDRLRFKMERGFQPSAETAEKLRIQPKDSPKPIFDDSFYQANLKVKTEKPSRLEPVKRFVESSVELADRLGGSISTRLKNINPVLKARLRKYEFDVRMLVKKDKETSEKLLEGFSKIRKSPDDFWTLDLALKNGDVDNALIIFKKYGLEDEYGKVKKILDDIWNRADEVGFDIGYQKDYWPRQIKDPQGFLEHLMGTEARSLIEEAFKRKEMALGRFLTIEERASLANTMIRGYRGGQITLSKTGAMKERVLDFVTPELNKFYQDADITLVNYIERTNDAIEARKFFGKQKALEGADKEALNNIKDSIGTFVADLMAKGEITALDEIKLRSILEARFNPAKTGLAIGVYKNLAYIDTLGSVVNAVTQLGDLAFAMYKGGPIRGLVEGAKSVIGKVKITKEDIGFAQREISSELERGGLGGLLDKLFRITGFNKIDRLGAEGLINASVRKAQQEALENSPRLLKELDSVFPEKLFGEGIKEQVLRELAGGEITDNVKFYAMNVLLDFSPRALSEMSETYLRSGNGRVFYILKTWTLKLFDVYRNEVFQVMKENPKQGIKNALELGILLFAMNATADEIKDFMRGRKTDFSDLVINNLAKLVGFSRYHTTQITREGLASTLGAELVPPLPAVDNISKDVIGLFKDFDKATDIANIRSIREIPIGGELFYWWFGPGREFIEKEKDETGLPKLPPLPPLPKLPSLPKLP